MIQQNDYWISLALIEKDDEGHISQIWAASETVVSEKTISGGIFFFEKRLLLW